MVFFNVYEYQNGEMKMLKVTGIGNFKSYAPNFSNNIENGKVSTLNYKYNLMSDTVSFKRASFDSENKELFSCLGNYRLAEKISDKSLITLNNTISKKFKNGETYIKLLDNVDDKSVFILNSGDNPINDNLMEFRQMIDAAKRSDAEKITAILPYLPYSRQDRISEEGEALTAKMVANDIVSAGADKVITFDLHSTQIQGFYDIPVKNLSAVPLFADYFRNKGDLDSFVVVSPDAGGIKRAKNLSAELKVPMAIIDKDRVEHNKATAISIVGNVEGKNCILVDDMIDTGGTITAAVKMIKDKGAKDVYICATHGIFSGDAFENIKNCPVKEVVVTDTLPLKEGAPANIKQISIAGLIAKEINK